MKFEKIKTLKILEFTYFYSLMLMVRLKDILHIDTPDWWVGREDGNGGLPKRADKQASFYICFTFVCSTKFIQG